MVKPIFSSIIDYNIACLNQQVNNLKKCDKLLEQSLTFLKEDVTGIETQISRIGENNRR